MRITVNLSIFFHDHRSLAKIFINKHMKCIKDVVDHIGEIFQIENFYLKFENQYLPPTEDIHILHNDDFIWAVPLGQHQTSVQNQSDFPTEMTTEVANTLKLEKKKKRQKCKDEDSFLSNKKKKRATYENEDPPVLLNGNSLSSEITTESDDTSKLEKKKKRRKHQSDDVALLPKQTSCENRNSTILEETEDVMIVSETPAAGKKKKKKKHTDDTLEECNNDVCENSTEKETFRTPDNKKESPKDSGRESLGSAKNTDTPPNNENVNVKSLVNTFENKQIDFSKPLMVNAVNENERKINIVKTIIISSGNKTSNAQKSDSLTSYNDEILNADVQATKTPPNVNMKKEDLNRESSVADKVSTAEFTMSDSDLLHTTTHLSNEDNLSSMSYNTISEFDTNVNKRRRRRTHRRKRTSKNFIFNNSSEKELPSEKTVSTQTPMHVRFSDDSTNLENMADEKSESRDSTQNNEVIIVSESFSNHDLQNQNIFPNNIPINNLLRNAELEEFILKQPITQNTQPRANDVIAFKILRLSESYTPEISSTVIGKVINYNLQSKEVLFEIVYGWDQCTQPQGKFSFNEEMGKETDNKFQCSWTSLLEPRVIYP